MERESEYVSMHCDSSLEVRGQLVGVHSLLSPHGSRGCTQGMPAGASPCRASPPAHTVETLHWQKLLDLMAPFLCNFIGVGRPGVLVPEHGKLAHAEFSGHRNDLSLIGLLKCHQMELNKRCQLVVKHL